MSLRVDDRILNWVCGPPDQCILKIIPKNLISSSESEYEDGDPNEINPNQTESQTEKNSSGNNFENKQKNLKFFSNFGNYENSDKSDEKTDELSRIRITRD